MPRESLEELTQERSNVKRDIKKWVSDFKKAHGCAPGEADKESVLELYTRYSEIERLLNTDEPFGEPPPPTVPELQDRIESLQGDIEQAHAKEAQAAEEASAAAQAREDLTAENQELTAVISACKSDAKVLLSIATQVCKQRATGEEHLARAELSCMRLKQRALAAEGALAGAKAAAAEHLESLKESLERIKALEDEQQAAVNAPPVTRSDSELQNELDCVRLEMETIKASALRESSERDKERFSAQKRESDLGEMLAVAKEQLTQRGSEGLAVGVHEAFATTQASLQQDKLLLGASLKDAEDYAAQQREEADVLLSGYKDYTELLEAALTEVTSSLSSASDAPQYSMTPQQSPQLQTLQCMQLIAQVERSVLRIQAPAEAALASIRHFVHTSAEHANGFCGQRHTLSAELAGLQSTMEALEESLQTAQGAGWKLCEKPAQEELELPDKTQLEDSELIEASREEEGVNEFTPAIIALDTDCDEPDLDWDTELI